LIVAALPLQQMKLGVSFVEALPADNPTRVAATAAETGFGHGILSPTELLVEGDGVAGRPAELGRLQQAIARGPGVAVGLGPATPALPEGLTVFRSRDGAAARFLLVLTDEPLGAHAVDTARRLQRELPGLLHTAGLDGMQASLGGDTAIA